MKRALWFTLLLVPAQSRAGDLEAALEQMAVATDRTYLEARDRAVALGASALRARLEAASWTDDGWRIDAMAAIARDWSERPAECGRVYTLDGLRPEVYLARRRPQPEVGRELRRMTGLGAVLFEALTRPLHRFSSPGDFPEHYREAAARLIANERAALRIGLIAALGRSGHPVAPFALGRLVTDPDAPDGERRAAAIALGEAGGQVADLARVARDVTLSDWLRGGAVIGIAKAARSQGPASVAVLRDFLRDPRLRRAATSGLAIAGSSWGASDAGLRADIAVLLTRELLSDEVDEKAIVEALSVVDHPAAVERLEVMRHDTKAEVRARAERALARLNR